MTEAQHTPPPQATPPETRRASASDTEVVSPWSQYDQEAQQRAPDAPTLSAAQLFAIGQQLNRRGSTTLADIEGITGVSAEQAEILLQAFQARGNIAPEPDKNGHYTIISPIDTKDGSRETSDRQSEQLAYRPITVRVRDALGRVANNTPVGAGKPEKMMRLSIGAAGNNVANLAYNVRKYTGTALPKPNPVTIKPDNEAHPGLVVTKDVYDLPPYERLKKLTELGLLKTRNGTSDGDRAGVNHNETAMPPEIAQLFNPEMLFGMRQAINSQVEQAENTVRMAHNGTALSEKETYNIRQNVRHMIIEQCARGPVPYALLKQLEAAMDQLPED